MTGDRNINRGRSRAKLVLDAEEDHGGGDIAKFAAGMLSAIGERLADRYGDLFAAEVIARFSDEVTLRVPAHEVMSITGKGKIP